MVRTRPTVILVMAILSIVFGSIWLLFWLCSGASHLLVYNMPVPQAGGGTAYPFRELYDLLEKEVPGFIAIEVANSVIGFILAVLLIVSGIGLLRMKNWARWTSVIYGVVTTVKEIAHFVFAWVYVNPVNERWTQEFIRKQPQGTPNFSGGPVFDAVASIGLLILTIGFGLVLVVMMFLPNVRAAFAGQSPGPLKEEDDYHDPRADEDVPEDRSL